jgi:hypothetical protein
MLKYGNKRLLKTNCAALLLLATTAGGAFAAAVPAQMFGKTVNFTYTVSIPTKLPNGNIQTTSRTETRTIYISSSGHVFMRNERRNSANKSEKIEQGPDQASGSVHYGNGALVGAVQHISGAYQFTIKFDSGFQSCNAEMIFGRAAGESHSKWKSVGGKILESAGKPSVSTSCSVASGNGL